MISIIIPMYNSEQTIIDCLSSIIKQTYKDFEIIIVNDGSTDKSMEIANNFLNENCNQPFLIINQPNSGVSTARNSGIIRATGQFIAFLDSDDTWHPEKLMKQISIINDNPQIVFLGCNRNFEFYGNHREKLFSLKTKDILFKMYPQTSTVIVRKEIFNYIGLYNTKMTHAEDGNLWLRITFNYPLYILNETLVTTGGMKKNFGISGLSANLKKMHHGNLENLKMCHLNKKINSYQLLVYELFYTLKYVIRIIKVFYWRLK